MREVTAKKRREISKMSNDAVDLAIDVLIDVFREQIEMHNALKEANSLLRSMNSIAERNGAETNWNAFRKKLSGTLAQEHQLLTRLEKTYPSRGSAFL